MRHGAREGFLDTEGNLAIPLAWDMVDDFSEGLAAVKRDRKWGYIDPTGALVIPLEWDYASPFDGGVAIADKGDEQHLIDRAGNTLYVQDTNCARMYEYYLEDGLLLVTDSPRYIDGKRNNAMHYGFVDFSGQTVVPCEYDVLYYADGYFYGLRDAWLTILDREGHAVF